MRRIIAFAAAVLALTASLVGLQTVVSATAPASAVSSGSAFQPGYIISDANFYNGSGMTAAQIQSFLTQQVGTCMTTSCLAKGSFTLDSHAADAMCRAVTGGTGVPTATIIARVSAACGIAPQVILTTLQKEQGLVTAKAPSAYALAAAMGYACPDTGNGCDPDYSGVGNQIYWSAWQWKRYGNPAGTSPYFTWLAPGKTHAIQYDVPTSCGTKSVLVQNAATAALYYYTPYTPNAAALNNLYGTGDSCSAYGNRNFWRIYNDWFGSPTGPGASTIIGSVDKVQTSWQSITVKGWAADSTTSSPTKVQVTIDGTPTTVPATTSRPDVGAAYPKVGSNHGYSTTLSVAAGSHAVCVVAWTVSGSASKTLACKTVQVQSGSPFGSVDIARMIPGGLLVSGWAIDPETVAPIPVRLQLDGKTLTTPTASGRRDDVARVYPASGPLHGFSQTIDIPAGNHTVCLIAVNVGVGRDTPLGSCAALRAPGHSPIGSLDSRTTTSSSLTLSGWALDGDTTGSIPVDIYVDGVGRRVGTMTSRSDIARIFPAYGAVHGFSSTWSLPAGRHSVVAYAINVGTGTNTRLWSGTVTITNEAPMGRLDQVTGSTGSLTASGWAIDPDTTAPISAAIQVDGTTVTTITANGNRSDVGRVYPQFGSMHGYTASIRATAGTHRVCAVGIDSAGGTNTTLGCRSVAVR